MHTVTFYSYKGGVGRTLVVANVAKYLARLGMKVFVLDFDLEAPGIHYKFEREPGKPIKIERGLVDILATFATTRHLPERLTDYVAEVASPAFATGTIHLLPAGDAPSPGYWRALSKVDWHTLFYAEEAEGIPLFLELKAFIEDTYAPDFVLIDARTGITEMGGVATTVLSDQVVCMLLPTPEHIEGTRQVMHAIRTSPRLEGAGEPNLIAVLSRLPHRDDAAESVVVNRVKDLLNAPIDALGTSLGLEDVAVLHREPALEEREQILVGSGRSLDDSLLLQDYVRLFVKLVPPREIEKSIGRLIEDINGRILSEPDHAEEALEALAKDCQHPEAYRALLTMYKARRSPISKRLDAAYVFWSFTKDARAPLLWDAIKEYRRTPPHSMAPVGPRVPGPQHLSAMEAIWRAQNPGDARFALELSFHYEVADLRPRAIRVLEANASTSGASVDTVARLIELLGEEDKQDVAGEVIMRHKEQMAAAPRFLQVWVEKALGMKSEEELNMVLDDPSFDLTVLEESFPALTARLRFFRTRDTPIAQAFLKDAKLSGRPRVDLLHLGALARDLSLGEFDAFKSKLAKVRVDSSTISQEIAGMPFLPDDISF